MKLKPMADNILLKQQESAETTVSGIVLATSNKEKPAIYDVVAVGPGTKDVTMTVNAGDKVVVSKLGGTDITLDKVDYKFVKQTEAEETTSSGIILATTNKEKPAIYEVVAVGPGTKDVTMTVSVGDKVVVSKFTGNDIKLDGEDYKFVKHDDILAVVTD